MELGSTDFAGLLRGVAELQAVIAEGPVVPFVNPAEIRSHLSRYDFAKPLKLEEVTADVELMLRKWQVQVTHPRYLGLFNPSVTAASVVGDALAAMYNPQLATWRTSPAANEIERHVLAWLIGKLGLPATAVANFTSGGAEANLSAMVVALTRAFPDYGEQGLASLPARPLFYLTSEAHHSFNKIAHITGIGRSAIRIVKIDRDLKMDVDDIAMQVTRDREEGFTPFMVIATAGTTGAGVIDPLPELGRFCRSAGLWFHVDAAWGGAAILSPRLRKYLKGIETADSIICDAHKWFSVPMGAGMFFCRDSDAVRQAFHAETSYMPKHTGDTFDPYTSSVQWSRRFIGLKLFLSLAHYGESGYVQMIEHQTRMADQLREALRRGGWQVVNVTPLPVVCFTRDGLNAAEFATELHRRQIAWISEVRLGGSAPVLRACITSFRTSESDIDRVVREMAQLN